MVFIKVINNYLNPTTVILKHSSMMCSNVQTTALQSKHAQGHIVQSAFHPQNQGSLVKNASFVYVRSFLSC